MSVFDSKTLLGLTLGPQKYSLQSVNKPKGLCSPEHSGLEESVTSPFLCSAGPAEFIR